MSKSYHNKHQVVEDFFPEGSHFPEKRQNWILLFSQNVRSSDYFEKYNVNLFCVEAAWCTVLCISQFQA